jgi:hypothetical protein
MSSLAHTPLLLLSLAASASAASFQASVLSSRLGHAFTDAEKPDLAIAVTNAPGHAIAQYVIQETDGPWKDEGTLRIPVVAGRGQAAFAPPFPGRGHYRLTAVVVADGVESKIDTSIGIVFPPARADPSSPWGVMYTPPIWFKRGDHAQAATDAADSLRLLGASWVRLNFYAYDFGEIRVSRRDGSLAVTCDPALARTYVGALRRQGLSIMGEICQMPTALSSRPQETGTIRDAGELRNRVKPRDYAEWNALISNLAATFRSDISAWEIWNEPNQPELGYWPGTPDEFLELVVNTSQAIKAGNPDARVLGCGFVHVNALVDGLFAKGLARHLDAVSVHYVNDLPEIRNWQELLRKHNISLPIWDTEERAEVPSIALANGIQRSFLFMHVSLPGPAGEGEYGGLCRTDFTLRPAGVGFSVGAHCIGPGRFAAAVTLGKDDYLASHFARGKEDVLVLTRLKSNPQLRAITLAIRPLDASKPVTVTDHMGRAADLRLKDGRAELLLENRPLLYINNAAAIETNPDEPTPQNRM